MKKLYILFLAFAMATVASCKYTFPETEVPTSGSADFNKVVAVGNSLTAGYMNGALYDAGQEASYANIVAQQIILIGGGKFNQPEINAEVGQFDLSDPTATAGRLHLVIPPGGGIEDAIPSPIIPGNPLTPYSGNKAELNNFGVPGMRIVDVAYPGYGTINPYYGRFASDAASATLLGDAISANGSFIIFWLGNNDALGYALAGATGMEDGTGSTDMTPVNVFSSAYSSAITAMMANGAKGIVANIPNVPDIPHFTTMPWDAIGFDTSNPTDDATVTALNAGYAVYNGGLDLMDSLGVITQEEANSRKIEFTNGANGIVIFDNSLTDLTSLDPGLVNMRMASANDLITLTAGAVLGTLADPNDPTSAIGVGVPLGEEYTLILGDQEAIAQRIADFNAVIFSVVEGSGGSLALLDINAIFADLSQNGIFINGAGMDATIIPPFGGFSLDGVHPNARGSAYVASLFIDKINGVFGSNIPNINPNDYSGNELPVP